LLVGIGQGGLGNSLSKAKMVESFAPCVENLSESLCVGHNLRKEGYDQEEDSQS
jgi:hypothetical protein